MLADEVLNLQTKQVSVVELVLLSHSVSDMCFVCSS